MEGDDTKRGEAVMETDLSTLADAECINLASFRRDGTEVRTPVWFVLLGGALYLRTARSFGKVKRIRREPAVRFAPCTWEGDVLGSWREGRAVLLEDTDPAVGTADQAMQDKYGERRREMTAMMAERGEPLVYIRVDPR